MTRVEKPPEPRKHWRQVNETTTSFSLYIIVLLYYSLCILNSTGFTRILDKLLHSTTLFVTSCRIYPLLKRDGSDRSFKNIVDKIPFYFMRTLGNKKRNDVCARVDNTQHTQHNGIFSTIIVNRRFLRLLRTAAVKSINNTHCELC